MQTSLGGLQNYEKDIRMLQVQVKQTNREIRAVKDSIGEQVFNLEEKISECQRDLREETQMKLDLISEKISGQEDKINQQFLESERQLELKIDGAIQLAFPDYNLQIME